MVGALRAPLTATGAIPVPGTEGPVWPGLSESGSLERPDSGPETAAVACLRKSGSAAREGPDSPRSAGESTLLLIDRRGSLRFFWSQSVEFGVRAVARPGRRRALGPGAPLLSVPHDDGARAASRSISVI
jgi:hypothetical protein